MSEYERLGVTPTPDDGTRLSEQAAWDEAMRPHRAPSGDDVAYSDRGCRAVAQHHGLAIEQVDRALVQHINHREDFEPLQHALDFLTDALLSHLSYEEHELVEPLARLGFYAGQL